MSTRNTPPLPDKPNPDELVWSSGIPGRIVRVEAPPKFEHRRWLVYVAWWNGERP